tara:strand:+ start:306 stop:575 length:270 start_codon:yes stop_codon:yes gene_type:complete
MKKITIYSSVICPYCNMAKKILQERNLNFSEIIIDNKPNLREEMEKKSLGRKTVPQIFFNNDLVGGYDDLNYLIEKDLLDEKLGVNDES